MGGDLDELAGCFTHDRLKSTPPAWAGTGALGKRENIFFA